MKSKKKYRKIKKSTKRYQKEGRPILLRKILSEFQYNRKYKNNKRIIKKRIKKILKNIEKEYEKKFFLYLELNKKINKTIKKEDKKTIRDYRLTIEEYLHSIKNNLKDRNYEVAVREIQFTYEYTLKYFLLKLGVKNFKAHQVPDILEELIKKLKDILKSEFSEEDKKIEEKKVSKELYILIEKEMIDPLKRFKKVLKRAKNKDIKKAEKEIVYVFTEMKKTFEEEIYKEKRKDILISIINYFSMVEKFIKFILINTRLQKYRNAINYNEARKRHEKEVEEIIKELNKYYKDLEYIMFSK